MQQKMRNMLQKMKNAAKDKSAEKNVAKEENATRDENAARDEKCSKSTKDEKSSIRLEMLQIMKNFTSHLICVGRSEIVHGDGVA